MNSFAVVDCETTGLDRESDRIVEIGVVLLSPTFGEEIRFETLVNPQRPLAASEIHGLRAADVAHAPTFAAIAPRLIELLSRRVIVAHNFPFDQEFINRAFSRAGYAEHIPNECAVDTLDQSRIYLPDGSHSLVGVAQRLGLPERAHHHALSDALTAADILRAFALMEARGERYTEHAHGRHGEVTPAQWERATPWRP
ncbi:DNA polymerase-3 subunit epsilon [Arcanobacterium wilhelmae]|uniref:DNA polymerase-3 subunit epsilon n=1 Tax=Arcanobacterium wilhelmae TaxID=1803177 RepID=A0ABT9NAC1_9ACTO|nr:3'-5' exonuclease [Arcanobacterium wilhelmae]MDP9800166.1 DNA polymerase-3 subunit epsilon [Arcanobacterium wilhelmae]WFN89606.1 3'-5' exonuclease [Arcanobacterium wilhelmae]